MNGRIFEEIERKRDEIAYLVCKRRNERKSVRVWREC